MGEIKFGVYNLEGLVPIMAINFDPPSARDRFNPYKYSVTNLSKFDESEKMRTYRETLTDNIEKFRPYREILNHIEFFKDYKSF